MGFAREPTELKSTYVTVNPDVKQPVLIYAHCFFLKRKRQVYSLRPFPRYRTFNPCKKCKGLRRFASPKLLIHGLLRASNFDVDVFFKKYVKNKRTLLSVYIY